MPLDPFSQTGNLVFIGAQGTGHFDYINPEGTEYIFNASSSLSGPRAAGVVARDGTRATLTYITNSQLKSVFTTRGLALLFDYDRSSQNNVQLRRVCAVNLAVDFVGPTSNCPISATSVSFDYESGIVNHPVRPYAVERLKSYTNSSNLTTYYRYDTRGHINCVIIPGNGNCRVQLTFQQCNQDPGYIDPSVGYSVPGTVQPELTLNEPVTRLINGVGLEYAYNIPQNCGGAPVPEGGQQNVSVTDPAGATEQFTFKDLAPFRHIDKSGREIVVENSGASFLYGTNFGADPTTPLSYRYPDGRLVEYTYDVFGNRTSEILNPRPGASGARIMKTASYPATCNNLKICHQRLSSTDANGSRTDFTYSPDHGGLLTETGPAGLGGVRPMIRNGYAQRFAWIKNVGGTYSPMASPVWLLVESRTCRTTATVGNGCASGPADEVVTTYDYGPNAGPNNLWLRGVAVTADGATLRTCYGYDALGNRISETTPRAGLGVCP